MKNILTIDTTNVCTCVLVSAYDTKTNEIIIEINLGNVVSPRLDISGTTAMTQMLKANANNQITIKNDIWPLSGSLRFRYADSVKTCDWFNINFPQTTNDIYIKRDDATTFTVVSKPVAPNYQAEIDALQTSVTELTNNKSNKRWISIGNATQGNKIHIPQSVYAIAYEYYIVVKTSHGATFPFYVPYNDVKKDMISGYYFSDSCCATARIMSTSRTDKDGFDISLNMAWTKELYSGNASTFELYIYYR